MRSARTGFTFEYSATFGQALTSGAQRPTAHGGVRQGHRLRLLLPLLLRRRLRQGLSHPQPEAGNNQQTETCCSGQPAGILPAAADLRGAGAALRPYNLSRRCGSSSAAPCNRLHRVNAEDKQPQRRADRGALPAATCGTRTAGLSRRSRRCWTAGRLANEPAGTSSRTSSDAAARSRCRAGDLRGHAGAAVPRAALRAACTWPTCGMRRVSSASAQATARPTSA